MDEKRMPAVCPVCGRELIHGMVGIDAPGKFRGYDNAMKFYPEKVNKRGEVVPDRDRSEPVKMPYGTGYGLFDPECYFKEAGYCPVCGKIVLLLDAVSGPQKTEE